MDGFLFSVSSSCEESDVEKEESTNQEIDTCSNNSDAVSLASSKSSEGTSEGSEAECSDVIMVKKGKTVKKHSPKKSNKKGSTKKPVQKPAKKASLVKKTKKPQKSKGSKNKPIPRLTSAKLKKLLIQAQRIING
jgi:hypothetical protein